MLHGGRTEDAFAKFEVLERRADFAEGRAEALGMTGPRASKKKLPNCGRPRRSTPNWKP